jgi:hypothetical protein
LSPTRRLELSRRRFLAFCLAAAGATTLPSLTRLNALRAYALLSSWGGFTPDEIKDLVAAADTIIPPATISAKVGAVTVPSHGLTGTIDFISNLLSGSFIFAAGAVRPPYVKLPAGVTANSFPAAGAIANDGPLGSTHLWQVKRIGWFGDGPRPTRPYPWPSELERLRDLYAKGIADLDQRSQSLGAPKFFYQLAKDPPGLSPRDLVLRQLYADEVNAFNGQGENGRVGDNGVRAPGQPFFLTFIDHVIEASFGDPAYGGNKDFIYWKAISFTGPAYLAGGGPVAGNGWTPRDMTQEFDPKKTWGDWTV